MILYHGSYVSIEKPDLNHSRLNVDFGKGFYTTPIYEQAKNWSAKFKKSRNAGIVSIYDFDEKHLLKLKVLKFDTYSLEWLDFIVDCRKGQDTSDYDLIIGGVANDKVFNTIELYFDGLIDKTEAIKRLKFQKPNLQIAFKSETALSCLKFKGSERL